MTRRMYDSTNAADIPQDAAMVAGYVDLWAPEDFTRWGPGVVVVRIVRDASVNDGHVIDSGEGVPLSACPGWATLRRSRGADPSQYVNLADWQAARDQYAAQGVPEPHWWVAAWEHDASVFPGAVAHQYLHPPDSGGHYDVSVVLDYWPGVDPAPPSGPGSAAEGDPTMLIQVNDYAEHPYYIVGPQGRRWITSPAEEQAWLRSGIHFEQWSVNDIAGIPVIPGTPVHP